MDAKVAEEPPQRNRMEKSSTSPLPPSFSSLPNEILLNCLARISRYHYRSFSLVSKSIRSLIYSPELYQSRSWMGNTEPYLYLCQRLPPYDRWFLADQTLITDGSNKDDELSLSPIAPSSSAPSKSSTVAVGFEIYQMGGSIGDDKQPSSAVHVFDCRTHTWRDAPNMTVARKRAESAFIDGKIFVIGGIEKDSSSMNWAEVFDLKTQTWMPLPSPCDDAKVEFSRGKLYVNSELKKYEYDSKQGIWKDVPKKVSLRKGPWCFIENVTFTVFRSELMWYDSKRRNWFMVKGLEDLYIKHDRIFYPRLWLANYGGKLVILQESLLVPGCERKRQIRYCKEKKKSILCTVIRLEKRIGCSGLEIWGKLELSNVVLILHRSYKFLSCITL